MMNYCKLKHTGNKTGLCNTFLIKINVNNHVSQVQVSRCVSLCARAIMGAV